VEGHLTARVTIDRSGRVLEAAIVGHSNSALLDDGVLALLRQATLPALPPDMPEPRITITVNVRYSLQ
jgi:TonB family protein